MTGTATERETTKRLQGAGLLCRAAEPSPSRPVDEKARTATFVAATERGVESWLGPEHLRMAGVRLARFAKNPIVLDAHCRHEAGSVVGRAAVRVEGRELLAEVTFAETPRAEELWQLVRQGFLRAVSVGFTVSKFSELERGQVDGEGESRVVGPAVVIHEWDLCEVSLVPLPADEDAVLRRSFYGARRAPENPSMSAPNARADAPAPAAGTPAKTDLARIAEKLGLTETATVDEILAALDEEETPAGEAADDMARASKAIEARAAELAKSRTADLERQLAQLESRAKATKLEADRRELELAREACAEAGDPGALDADLERDVLADFARGDDARARRELQRARERAKAARPLVTLRSPSKKQENELAASDAAADEILGRASGAQKKEST